jgi:hypothetical protein
LVEPNSANLPQSITEYIWIPKRQYCDEPDGPQVRLSSLQGLVVPNILGALHPKSSVTPGNPELLNLNPWVHGMIEHAIRDLREIASQASPERRII